MINESNSAVAYLLHRYSESDLYPTDPATLALAWQWAEWGETTLAPTQNNVFFPVVRQVYSPAAGKQGCPGKEEIQVCAPRLAVVWSTLERQLADRSFILGERFTMADFTAAVQASRCSVFVSYLIFFDIRAT